MTKTEKTQLWALFAANAANGYLSCFADPNASIPKADQVHAYACKVAFELLKTAMEIEEGQK